MKTEFEKRDNRLYLFVMTGLMILPAAAVSLIGLIMYGWMIL